jgi:hypothetical protein
MRRARKALKLARLFRATAIGIVCLGATPIATAAAEASRIDTRAEIAAAPYSASATQAAVERLADARLFQARMETDRLRGQGATMRAQLAQAQEDQAALSRALAQSRNLERRGTDIPTDPWTKELRALARVQ